jgi:hypothetical protein
MKLPQQFSVSFEAVFCDLKSKLKLSTDEADDAYGPTGSSVEPLLFPLNVKLSPHT